MATNTERISVGDLKTKYGINDRKSVESLILALLSLPVDQTFNSLLANIRSVGPNTFEIIPHKTQDQQTYVNVHDARNILFLPEDLE